VPAATQFFPILFCCTQIEVTKIKNRLVGNIIGVGPNSPRRSGRNLPVGAVFVKLLAASDPVLASSVDPKSITEIAVIKSIKTHSLQS
jgi:hypothetical protein